MNLFTRSRANGAKTNSDRQKLSQIKVWTRQALNIEPDIAISINQLQCHEAGCPDLETVIVLMTSPPQKYKISKPVSEITEQDISLLTN